MTADGNQPVDKALIDQQQGPRPDDWDRHWQEKATPWDLGGVTPSLVHWCEHNSLAGRHVMVPGCGAGHDAHFLSRRAGAVTAVDISAGALQAAREAYPQSRTTWLHADLFTMDPSTHQYDAIWEYTCYCAMGPARRDSYGDRIHALLKPGGIYWGLVFATVTNPDLGPPFQVAPEAFRDWLAARFVVDTLDFPAPHSVKPRRGTEIWFQAHKPATRSST